MYLNKYLTLLSYRFLEQKETMLRRLEVSELLKRFWVMVRRAARAQSEKKVTASIY